MQPYAEPETEYDGEMAHYEPVSTLHSDVTQHGSGGNNSDTNRPGPPSDKTADMAAIATRGRRRVSVVCIAAQVIAFAIAAFLGPSGDGTRSLVPKSFHASGAMCAAIVLAFFEATASHSPRAAIAHLGALHSLILTTVAAAAACSIIAVAAGNPFAAHVASLHCPAFCASVMSHLRKVPARRQIDVYWLLYASSVASAAAEAANVHSGASRWWMLASVPASWSVHAYCVASASKPALCVAKELWRNRVAEAGDAGEGAVYPMASSPSNGHATATSSSDSILLNTGYSSSSAREDQSSSPYPYPSPQPASHDRTARSILRECGTDAYFVVIIAAAVVASGLLGVGACAVHSADPGRECAFGTSAWSSTFDLVTFCGICLSLTSRTISRFNSMLSERIRNGTAEIIRNRRSFMRYVFHEIRMPLNTMSLVLENAEGAEAGTVLVAPPMHPQPSGGAGMGAAAAVESGEFRVPADDMRSMRSSIQQISQILNQSLFINEIERGHVKPSMAPMCMRSTIRDMVRIYEPMCKAAGIQLSHSLYTNLSNMKPVTDAMRVRLVFSNYLNNAIHFTPKGGTIDLRVAMTLDRKIAGPKSWTRRQATGSTAVAPAPASAGEASGGNVRTSLRIEHTCSIHIDVTDTGVGFDPSHADDLFVPFSMVRAVTTTGTIGAGMGLSMCKSVADLLGGDVFAMSKGRGKGATFSFAMKRVGCTDQDLPAPAEDQWRMRVRSRNDSKENVRLESGMVPMVGIHSEHSLHQQRQRHTPQGREEGEAEAEVEAQMPEDTGEGAGGGRPVETEAAPGCPSGTAKDTPRNTMGSARALLSPIQTHACSGTITSSTISTRSPTPQLTSLRNLRVLVVEDSESILKQMVNLCKRMGASHVQGCEDGKKGLDAVKAALAEGWAPDVVMTDLSMPNMDGADMTRRIRELGYSGAIIGTSGHSLKEDVAMMIKAGMDVAISKPVTKADIDRATREAISLARDRGFDFSCGSGMMPSPPVHATVSGEAGRPSFRPMNRLPPLDRQAVLSRGSGSVTSVSPRVDRRPKEADGAASGTAAGEGSRPRCDS